MNSHSSPSAGRARRLILGAVLGMLAAAMLWLAIFVALGRQSTPRLTETRLAEAEHRWNASGVRDYRLELEIEGRQPGEVTIEVRNGEAVAMTRDGRTPSQSRTWDYWTVPNQFATIAQDLNGARDPAQAFGAPPGSQVVQRAEFDASLGYPRRYERLILGTPLEVRWTITRFERLK